MSDIVSVMAERGIRFEYTDALCEFVVEKSYSRKFGARNMRRFIESNVEDAIAELLISSKGKRPGTLTADVENGKIIVK